MKNLHVAYNTTTFEIIQAPTASGLRKAVKWLNGKGCRWVFGHNGLDALFARLKKNKTEIK